MSKITKVRVASHDSTRKGEFVHLLVNTNPAAFAKALSDAGMDENTHHSRLTPWLAAYFGKESVDDALFRIYSHFCNENCAVEPEVDVSTHLGPVWSINNKHEGLVELQFVVIIS